MISNNMVAHPKFLRKGELTRAAILDVALKEASCKGLEGLTIGLLADLMKMSKSGVFAHCSSREDLQIAVLELYHERFAQDVFYPSIQEARGLPRLQSMFARWLIRIKGEIKYGCIYISGAVEYDDRPGPVRDKLADMVRTWQSVLQRAVEQSMEMGHLRKGIDGRDVDAKQIVYEMYGLILALHHDARFLKIPDSVQRTQYGFERLINSYRTPPPGSASHSAPVPGATAALTKAIAYT